MKKRLVLIRHAKSSWKFPQLIDHDRPLNKRGIKDSTIMAEVLASKEAELQAVFSSTAVRACQLAKTLVEHCDAQLITRSALYTFSSTELLQSIQTLPDTLYHCAVVGHNPAITEVASRLAQQSFDNIPTSGMVAIQSDSESWSQIVRCARQCDYFHYPKLYG